MSRTFHTNYIRPILNQVLLLMVSTFSVFAVAQTALAPDARSVHLWYGTGEAEEFYNEVEITDSADGSYYMAIGFNGGYFGIQDLSGDEGLVIFSLWDNTQEPVRTNVPESDRASVLEVGENVSAVPFGNEGVGISVRLPYQWEVGDAFRFFISTKVVVSRTRYTAYFASGDGDWRLIGVLDRPAAGVRLAGLYSFVEDFRRDGFAEDRAIQDRSPNQLRTAIFSNPWAMSSAGSWSAINSVKFTAWSPHPLNTINAEIDDYEDRIGVGFILETGGDTTQTTELESQLSSPTVLRSRPEMPGDL